MEPNDNISGGPFNEGERRRVRALLPTLEEWFANNAHRRWLGKMALKTIAGILAIIAALSVLSDQIAKIVANVLKVLGP